MKQAKLEQILFSQLCFLEIRVCTRKGAVRSVETDWSQLLCPKAY